MLSGGKTAVYKSSVVDGALIIKGKLAAGETINSREWELLSYGGIRGIMKVEKGSFNRLVFTAPESEPLKRFLMQGLTKEEFASVLAQLVRVLTELDRYALQISNLELHIEYVYITRKTRELIFIYRPTANRELRNDLNGFIRSLIEYTTFSSLQDRAYVSELESILRDIERFPPKTISDYVCRLDKTTYDRELSNDMGEDSPTQVELYQTNVNDMSRENQDYGRSGYGSARRHYDTHEGGIDESTGLYEVYDGFDIRPEEKTFEKTYGATGDMQRNYYSGWEEEPTSVEDDDDLTDVGTIYTDEDIGSWKGSRSQDIGIGYDEPLTGMWEESESPSYDEEPSTSVESEDYETDVDIGSWREPQPQNGGIGYDEPLTGMWEEPESPSYDYDPPTSVDPDPYNEPNYKPAFDMPNGRTHKNGSAKPRVLATLERCSTGEVYAIKQDEILIGKDRLGADIYIDGNPAVSRRHAIISEHAGKFYITDMRSLNHTFVNGKELRAEQRCEIKDGSRLCLADENFIFHIR